ncbi:MAG: hypothetical protein RL189_1962, partial [Pseudomonadota bacterium]
MTRFSLDWNSDSKKNSVFVGDYFALVALSAAIVVCLSVYSFNPRDASAFHLILTSSVASGTSYRNLLGSFGANISEWLIQLFGLGAYVFSAVALVHSLQLFQRPRVRARWALRLFGYPQLILCFLGLLASFRDEISFSGIPFPISGWLGLKVVGGLTPVLSVSGVRIVLLAGLLTSLPLCLGVNPVAAVVWLLNRLPWSRFKEIAAEASDTETKEKARAVVSEAPVRRDKRELKNVSPAEPEIEQKISEVQFADEPVIMRVKSPEQVRN